MLYALSSTGEKISPSPGIDGYCQSCEQLLVPKCGDVNIWHWAHKSVSPNCEGSTETEWHRSWKARFPKENTEVRIIKDGIMKVADVLTKDGVVIELQHSAITPEEIKFREHFYGSMKWIFDCREPYMEDRLRTWPKEGRRQFIWVQPKRSLEAITKPLYFDTTYTLLSIIQKQFNETPYRGVCSFYSFDDFINDHT